MIFELKNNFKSITCIESYNNLNEYSWIERLISLKIIIHPDLSDF